MHHGTIEAQKRTDARGSVFTVGLLLGTAHLTDAEIEQEPQEAVAQPQHAKTQTSRYRVLVVDDDLEIGNYISSELSNYYKITICTNGKEGLKELLARSSGENDYDVVVSDVMMPEMDGFTRLRMIKTNLNISHIPVIMLTSKADVGNRLEGLERGADAFIAKPFDMEELHMTIDNLIQTRQRLKGKFTGAQQQADKLEQPEVKGNDEQLMERIMKVVNKNLSNSDFNVDMLSREVGISRAQLHRKMKELTGIPTSEFIRNIRLEQAARLLKEQKINVTQVAYTVGFSNLAHFSTIFRKHFGVAPSEYAEQAAGAE
jgi:DNA-binding response OmpR family regulator